MAYQALAQEFLQRVEGVRIQISVSSLQRVS
jgi:hypothetical protein